MATIKRTNDNDLRDAKVDTLAALTALFHELRALVMDIRDQVKKGKD